MKSLLGGILLAVGILIAGASGLCSLVFLGMGVSEPSGLVDVLPMIFVVGGIPFEVGLGLFFLGRSLIRSGRRDAEQALARDQDQP
jgi:hypothetical protein